MPNDGYCLHNSVSLSACVRHECQEFSDCCWDSAVCDPYVKFLGFNFILVGYESSYIKSTYSAANQLYCIRI